MALEEETPLPFKSPHDVHMERAIRGQQHAAIKKPRGVQPGTFSQKHPRDSQGRFRNK